MALDTSLASVNFPLPTAWIRLGLHTSAQFRAEAEGKGLFLEANGVTIQSLWMGNAAECSLVSFFVRVPVPSQPLFCRLSTFAYHHQ